MKLSEVTLQEKIISSLKAMLRSKNLSHAFLLSGSDTGAAFDIASAFADAMLCETAKEDACGNCLACKKTLAGTHPDKIIVESEKQTLGIDSIRELISKMYIRPYFAGKKVFIIKDAHKLTKAAANALLKVLETPPAYGVMILTSRSEDVLLATILSRVTKFKLRDPSIEQIESFLNSRHPKSPVINLCAKLCAGKLSLAEQLVENSADFDQRKKLLRFLSALRSNSSVFDFKDYLEENKKDITEISEYMLLLIRDLVLIKRGLLIGVVNGDLKQDLIYSAALFSVAALYEMALNIADLQKNLRGNASYGLAVSLLLLKTTEDYHD